MSYALERGDLRVPVLNSVLFSPEVGNPKSQLLVDKLARDVKVESNLESPTPKRQGGNKAGIRGIAQLRNRCDRCSLDYFKEVGSEGSVENWREREDVAPAVFP